MAWQLIYTSAARLLEAGRTGFGTVARHREIPPLVAQAVERQSQFARLPGMDMQRMIYSHRIVTSAGLDYHILSKIKSAGSDYTGRTNHVAHHYIVTEHEAANCAAAGQTPAALLLSLPWLDVWMGAARYLERHDELSLATLPAPPATHSAWAAVSQRPEHARLLVYGPGSQGCCLNIPEALAVLPLYAESSAFAPQQAWGYTFTTALEPTDQASDFRWIALPADSPLAPVLQGSGRLWLDLAQPSSLPEPSALPPANHGAVFSNFPGELFSTPTPASTEANTRSGRPQETSESSIPETSALTTADTVVGADEVVAPYVPPTAAAAALRRPAASPSPLLSAAAASPNPLSSPKSKNRSRRLPPWVAVVLILLLGIAGFAAYQLWQGQQRDHARQRMTQQLGSSGEALSGETKTNLLQLPAKVRDPVAIFSRDMLAALAANPPHPRQLVLPQPPTVKGPDTALPEEIQRLIRVHAAAKAFTDHCDQIAKGGLSLEKPASSYAEEGLKLADLFASEHLPSDKRVVFRNACSDELTLAAAKSIQHQLTVSRPAKNPDFWRAMIHYFRQEAPRSKAVDPAIQNILSQALAIVEQWAKPGSLAQTQLASPWPQWLQGLHAPPAVPTSPNTPPQPAPASPAPAPQSTIPEGIIYVLPKAGILDRPYKIAEIRPGLIYQIYEAKTKSYIDLSLRGQGILSIGQVGDKLLEVNEAAKTLSRTPTIPDTDWSYTSLRVLTSKEAPPLFRLLFADQWPEPLLGEWIGGRISKPSGKDQQILTTNPGILDDIYGGKLYLDVSALAPESLRGPTQRVLTLWRVHPDGVIDTKECATAVQAKLLQLGQMKEQLLKDLQHEAGLANRPDVRPMPERSPGSNTIGGMKPPTTSLQNPDRNLKDELKKVQDQIEILEKWIQTSQLDKHPPKATLDLPLLLKIDGVDRPYRLCNVRLSPTA